MIVIIVLILALLCMICIFAFSLCIVSKISDDKSEKMLNEYIKNKLED